MMDGPGSRLPIVAEPTSIAPLGSDANGVKPLPVPATTDHFEDDACASGKEPPAIETGGETTSSPANDPVRFLCMVPRSTTG
jgi:hypothetical protein